jgi:fumarate hydratase class II
MTSIETLNDDEFRIEHDTMGEVRVPVNALYRAQTQRAVENFPISGKTLERAHIEALARVKKAAAQANAELGVLDDEIAQAIAAAADEVAAGKYDGDFPIDVFQTGSGTSSNMNTNEVLAELAPSRPPVATKWSTRTTTSTPRSPPTTSSRRRSTWPPRPP